MADIKMNQAAQATSASYVYAEASNGGLVKVPVDDLFGRKQVKCNKGETINLGTKVGVLFVFIASSGSGTALFLVDSLKTILVNQYDKTFSAKDDSSQICVYKLGANKDVIIRNNLSDNCYINYAWL